MSLIATCRLCGVNPFSYLTVLLRNTRMSLESPDERMLWNYLLALTRTPP